MERDSFIFYRSFFEAIDEVDEKEQLNVYRAIAIYALNREETNLNGIAKVLWRLIKPQLDANWQRYENGCKGAEHGIKGGAPLGNKNASKEKQPQNNPTTVDYTTANVNVNENHNVNVNGGIAKEEKKKNKEIKQQDNHGTTNNFKGYNKPTAADNIRKAFGEAENSYRPISGEVPFD